jgi:S-DNA-T family DNA segregation ATPase FtsK/SpoIIIE
VTLVIATQRPTQKVMGQGAVRSQMNIRIAFRIQEQRDVDLILGQGMLKAGWHAHKLNAPGKFLVWSPEHDTPRRARAYLITDDDVQQAVARHAPARPQLDAISRHALTTAPAPAVIPERDEAGDSTRADPAADERDATGNALWLALRMAPEEGCEIAELIRLTGMTRSTLYRRLREHARQGHAIQVSRGRWRAQATDEPSP